MNTVRSDSPVQPVTLVVAATFTAQAIERALAFWTEELDLQARIVFTPYNQPFQQLLDPSSVLSTNRDGVNIIMIRLEDWHRAESNGEPAPGAPGLHLDLGQNVSDFVGAVTEAAKGSVVPFVIVMCPPSPPANADSTPPGFFEQFETQLVAGLTPIPGVDVITSSELMAAYPVKAFHDPQGDKIAHVPYTPLFFTALATMIARRLYALTQANYKALVVDCDNTLWTGVCGEDGPLGVEIDSARQAIQDYLVQLHNEGVLLCLCSRNNEADVRAVFEQRSDMRLELEHVAASRFNWQPKSENIRALASELHFAPDAFVFLDDDAVECAEVQANCPEVLTIQLPRQTVPGFLRNLWIFHDRNSTEEARQRTAFYRQNAARERVLQDVPSLADFLASLDLKIHTTDLAPPNLARASELTHRTNQFNITTIRRSEAQIEALRQQGAGCVVVRVKDRFGDYGLVGLMIFSADSEALLVDTFLLSCRALGRGVEHRMLARLGQIATERGLTRVDLPFAWSGRNQPALDFLKETGEAFEEPRGSDSTFRIPAGVAAQVRYRPGERRVEDPKARNAVGESVLSLARGDARAKAALLVSIARDLSDPEQVHAQVTARTGARPELDGEYVAPRTPTEQTIATILAQVLGIDRVGAEDNFFQLGGHSLLAMQVLFRIREAFQVELSARLLYNSAFTAADLAAKVQQLQVEAADRPNLAEVLARLNELSDDEVRALLASNAGAPPPPTE